MKLHNGWLGLIWVAIALFLCVTAMVYLPKPWVFVQLSLGFICLARGQALVNDYAFHRDKL
jgi:hypothetical protein